MKELNTDGKADGLFALALAPDGLDPQQMSPLNLAFIGDAVHSLYVRTRLTQVCAGTSGRLHGRAVGHVSAQGQARVLAALADQLTAEEQCVLRRGRNAHPPTMPRSSSPGEYHSATALEALLGYLYLGRQWERLEIILGLGFDLIEGNGCKEDEDAGS